MPEHVDLWDEVEHGTMHPARRDALRALLESERASEDRLQRVTLAASRGAYAAAVWPDQNLGDAARALHYRARTLEGDAFETAFLWAREDPGEIQRPAPPGPVFDATPRITVLPTDPGLFGVEVEGLGRFTVLALGTLIGRLRCAMVSANTKGQALAIMGAAVCGCPRVDVPSDGEPENGPGYTREVVTHDRACGFGGPEAIP